MRRRVFIVAGEYSANPRDLPPERRSRDFYFGPHPTPAREQMARLFFRYPNRGDEGRIRPEDWQRAFGLSKPLGLPELFASAAHKALTTLHELQGGDYRRTCESITDMLVTSMPGLDPYERLNIGLVPQGLQVLLGLSPRARSQFVVGTSDSGAQAFAEAVRTARTAERPSTILVLAGQVIPAGYASQYQIRTVLGEDDQARGMDMLAVGDTQRKGHRSFGILDAGEGHGCLDRRQHARHRLTMGRRDGALLGKARQPGGRGGGGDVDLGIGREPPVDRRRLDEALVDAAVAGGGEDLVGVGWRQRRQAPDRRLAALAIGHFERVLNIRCEFEVGCQSID